MICTLQQSPLFHMNQHQLTWALGCRVGPSCAHSGCCLDIHLCLQIPSLTPLFNLLVTESHSPLQGVKPQTMAVVSAKFCFPHAPPLFVLSPLSLIKVPYPTLSKAQITGRAQRCVAQHKVRWAVSQQTPSGGVGETEGESPGLSGSPGQPESLNGLGECLQLLLITLLFPPVQCRLPLCKDHWL